MTRLQCGCASPFGEQCSRPATQEDLLCDQCREGRTRNAVIIYADNRHQHLAVDPTEVRLR